MIINYVLQEHNNTVIIKELNRKPVGTLVFRHDFVRRRVAEVINFPDEQLYILMNFPSVGSVTRCVEYVHSGCKKGE